MRLRKSKKLHTQGYTLVEALVGGIVLAICAAILATGFLTAFSLMKKGTAIKNKGLAASSVIEGATESGITESTAPGAALTYQINSQQYTVSGSYKTAYDDTSSTGFTVFLPN